MELKTLHNCNTECHGCVQKSIGIISVLFPDAATDIGRNFEVTIQFYNSKTMESVLLLKTLEFRIPGPADKAQLLGNEILLQFSPQIEELMLIYGPMPMGAVAFPAENFFDFRGGMATFGFDYGYALIRKITGDIVIVQFGNGGYEFTKQDVLKHYKTFVTDLVPLDPLEESQLLLAALSLEEQL